MDIKQSSGMPSEDNMVEPVTGAPEVEETPEVEATEIDHLLDALAGREGSPQRSDLETWKAVYGNFYASSVLGDDNIYIWRTMKRGEYKQIAGSGAMKDQMLYEDAVIRKCLIYPYPQPEWFQVQDAGVMPTLFKQIMYKSGFVSEEMALTLINVI